MRLSDIKTCHRIALDKVSKYVWEAFYGVLRLFPVNGYETMAVRFIAWRV